MKEAYFLVSILDKETLYVHYRSKYSVFSKKYHTQGSYTLEAYKEGACVFDLKNAQDFINSTPIELKIIDVKTIFEK